MIFLTILVILLLGISGTSLWFLYFNNKSLVELHKRINNIFSVDFPATNEATKKDNNNVELNEQNMLNIPPDVKFEVEGGDENIPPGYTPAKSK